MIGINNEVFEQKVGIIPWVFNSHVLPTHFVVPETPRDMQTAVKEYEHPFCY